MQPREYAAQILQLSTREARKAALQQVPDAWQGLVRKHCEIAWNHPSRHKLKKRPQPNEQP